MSIENIDKLAQDVLFLSRNKLALNLRFMDKPISMLDLQKVPKLNGVAVDGTCIYYDPIVVLRNFSEEQARIPRQYLHMILHCVYQHFWVSSTVNKILWDLSCDIAVEYTIFDMAIPALEIKSAEMQQKAFQYFKKKVKYMTADMLYKYLLNAPLSEKQVYTLAEIFSADIHKIWYQSKWGKTNVPQNTEADGNSKYSQDCQEDDLSDTKEHQQPYNGQDKEDDDEDNEHCEERKENLAGITKILDDYDEIYGDWQLSARITGVLRFLAYQAEEEYKYHSFTLKDFSNDMVQIMTVHKAKGLEFHTVFLPELMMREFPASNVGGKKYWHVLGGIFEENKSKYQGDLEDERKLFYVAVTRARQNLFMTYELSEQPISCFVTEAAASQVLKINRADLTYTQTNDSDITQNDYMDENPISSSGEQRKAEQKARQQYWNTVRYAKRQLYNYYGTACHYFPGAHGDLERLRTLSPDEILRLAATNGLI